MTESDYENWPDDIVELADHLGLDKFIVEGISGGGPYSAVCAYKIPHRLDCCAIVAGLGPVDMKKEGMHKLTLLMQTTVVED